MHGQADPPDRRGPRHLLARLPAIRGAVDAGRDGIAAVGTPERAGRFGFVRGDVSRGELVAWVRSSVLLIVIHVWGWSVFFFFHFFHFFLGRSLGLNAWKSQDFSGRLGGGRVWGWRWPSLELSLGLEFRVERILAAANPKLQFRVEALEKLVEHG